MQQILQQLQINSFRFLILSLLYCSCRGKEGKLPEPETGWTSRCTPVVDRSLEHHTVDSTIFLVQFPPNLKEEHPGGSGTPTSLPFHQPHKRTCGWTAI
ncbi:hypothetical protein TNCV_1009831 [Trichonephila clavipes]|nr:hypothetical protein TNCV_1009831 [Trichonephila clavipes]